MRKTSDIISLPSATNDVLSLVSKILVNDVRRIVVDFDEEKIVVDWNQYFDEPLVPEAAIPTIPSMESILKEIEIKQVPRSSTFRETPIQHVALAMQLLGNLRSYPVAWVCKNKAKIREWLGLPDLVQLDHLLGVPLYAVDNAEDNVLYLLGCKRQFASLSAVSDVMALLLEEEEA